MTLGNSNERKNHKPPLKAGLDVLSDPAGIGRDFKTAAKPKLGKTMSSLEPVCQLPAASTNDLLEETEARYAARTD